jgi:osmoprotectant transport system permease protein
MGDIWTTAEFWEQTATFLLLVLGSLGIALLIGLPVGILLTRLRRISGPVIAVLGLLQTFPSLALLGLLIPLVGVGQPAAIFLAVVYSLFPVVLNAYVGITQVPVAVRDAARGMGMTEGQILRQVELPLALPVLLAGVRTGAVYAISLVTIAALAAAGGLGDYIVRGTETSNNDLLLAGALPLLALTLLIFWGLGGVAWVARRRSHLGLLVGGGLIAALSAVGVWVVGEQIYQQRQREARRAQAQAPAGRTHLIAQAIAAQGLVSPGVMAPVVPQIAVTLRVASFDAFALQAPPGSAPGLADRITVGAKNFVEGRILAQVVKQMLEAHTSLRVDLKQNLTPSLIFKALKRGDIDLYPEYTGVLLTNKEALDLPIPADRSTITALVRKEILDRHQLVLLKTFGLNNTYVFCTTKATAAKYGLRTIGDLRRFAQARVVVDLSFLDRQDGWPGLVKAYGLDLPRPKLMAPDLRYKALESGDVDVVLGFATDWEIGFYKLAVLDDDRHYFPSYHGAPLVRADVLRRHPEIGKVLGRLHGRIDDATMRRLNAQVARERREPAAVAREFLEAQGLLP